MDKNQKVSLGCGTLILIALIVLIFGAGPNKKQMEEISQELRGLQAQVSSQMEEIQALKGMVEKLFPSATEIPTNE